MNRIFPRHIKLIGLLFFIFCIFFYINSAKRVANVFSQSNTRVDLKINNSNGPISVSYESPLEFSWTSENADFCYAYGDSEPNTEWKGSVGLSGKRQGLAIHSFAEYSIFCGNNNYPDLAIDSVFVSITLPTSTPTPTPTPTLTPTPTPWPTLTPTPPPPVNWNCSDSSYYGQQIWTCSGSSRYRCQNGIPVSEYCANGCVAVSLGQNDYCRDTQPTPPPPTPWPTLTPTPPPPTPWPTLTPTPPTPPPSSGYCSSSYLAKYWNSQNLGQWWYSGIADDAAKVCMCESGGNPEARLYRPPTEDSRGLFQINITVHNYDVSRLYEPVYNINSAIDIFKKRADWLSRTQGCTNKRAGWEPWSCAKPPYGIYQCK
ncbi:MAG: hypothetical protein ABIF89_02055 [bacterium]